MPEPAARDPGGAARRRRKLQALRGEALAPALDAVIHERVRLGIVSALAGGDALTFRELKERLHLTDGNLSVHARKLEDAGYVACRKAFEGRKPKTTFRLTAAGRRALDRYLDHLQAVIEASGRSPGRPSGRPSGR